MRPGPVNQSKVRARAAETARPYSACVRAAAGLLMKMSREPGLCESPSEGGSEPTGWKADRRGPERAGRRGVAGGQAHPRGQAGGGEKQDPRGTDMVTPRQRSSTHLSPGPAHGQLYGDPDHHTGPAPAQIVVHLGKAAGKIRSAGAEDAVVGSPDPMPTENDPWRRASASLQTPQTGAPVPGAVSL